MNNDATSNEGAYVNAATISASNLLNTSTMTRYFSGNNNLIFCAMLCEF